MLPFLSSKELKPVILAPLSGLTDAPFRACVERFGASWTVSEMVAGEALRHRKREAVRRLSKSGEGCHVVQLAGHSADDLAEAAREVENQGALMIDINMGCPAKRVAGRLCGAALMRDPDYALRLIEAVRSAVSVPVSVKMRLGWDETQKNAPELAKRAESAGVSMVTVHGRTRAQFYKGHADWRAIRDVVKAVNIPVIANGDLCHFQDITAMLEDSQADGLMVGRGALGRPWFLSQIMASLAGQKIPEAPSFSNQATQLIRLYRDGLSLYGKALGVRHMRSHIDAALKQAFQGRDVPQDTRAAILQNDDPKAVEAAIDSCYETLEMETMTITPPLARAFCSEVNSPNVSKERQNKGLERFAVR